MERRAVYLDYAATSPVDPRVAQEMSRCLTLDGVFANPSSAHRHGAEARRLVERARAVVAARVGAEPEGIVFTSGATESNNLALKGVLAGAPPDRRHFVTTRIEHKSVLDTARALEAAGCTVTYVACDSHGIVPPDSVAKAIGPGTGLVSVMHVNNETGAVQDVAALASICRERRVALHVDAAQSVGKVPLDLRGLGVDLCSLTAHKACGPKGVGALYLRPGMRLTPQLHGGEQQNALRPGTLPTHQIVGMAKAYELADPAADAPRINALREQLWRGLEAIEGVRLNGDPERTAPHILNVAFPGVDGESLRCSLREIAVSAGSACTSDSPDASHVLTTMGLSDAVAMSSIRFSMGRFTTREDVSYVARRVADEVARLRAIAGSPPCWCSGSVLR
jgi:cysteine desulfurase